MLVIFIDEQDRTLTDTSVSELLRQYTEKEFAIDISYRAVSADNSAKGFLKLISGLLETKWDIIFTSSSGKAFRPSKEQKAFLVAELKQTGQKPGNILTGLL